MFKLKMVEMFIILGCFTEIAVGITPARVVKLRIRAYPGKLEKWKFRTHLKIENKNGNFGN